MSLDGSNPDERFATVVNDAPDPQTPIGRYRPVTKSGSQLYVSGHGPKLPDGSMITGRIGSEPKYDLEHGQRAARQVALGMLRTLQSFNGTLNNLRLVKTLGMALTTPDFTQHPLVINGFSDLVADVLGEEHGVGSRSAVGWSSLPGAEMAPGSPQISVEVEAIFEIVDQ